MNLSDGEKVWGSYQMRRSIGYILSELGYDSYSEGYIAHQTDGANDWYYKISEELYYIFDKDRVKYLEQIEKDT